jgi:hypothetical protein
VFRAGWAASEEAIETYLHDDPIRVIPVSPGHYVLGGSLNAALMNSRSSPVSVSVTGAQLMTDTGAIAINGVHVPVTQTASTISTAANVLPDGKNVISVAGADSSGLELSETFTIWAGSRSLGVTVRDWRGIALPNATVWVYPQTTVDVYSEAFTSGGGTASIASLSNK